MTAVEIERVELSVYVTSKYFTMFEQVFEAAVQVITPGTATLARFESA